MRSPRSARWSLSKTSRRPRSWPIGFRRWHSSTPRGCWGSALELIAALAREAEPRSSPSTPMPVVFGLPNSSCRSCHRRCCSTRASSSIHLENRGVLTALPSRRFGAGSTARPPHSPPRVFGAAIRSSRKRRLRRQSHLLCPVSARLIVTRVEVVAPNAGPYVRDVALGTRGAGYWSHVMPSSRRPRSSAFVLPTA